MGTKDINLYESGTGGEISISSNDLNLGESLFQQVYLALFGGNLEAVTRGDELIGEERLDWWGNSLFLNDNPNKQFNSITEKTLQNVVLNSSGRLKIIQAVKEDLSYLSDLLDFSINVVFEEVNNIKIIINFTQKGTQENRVLELVYNNAKNEIIIERIV
jgi:phage gp46-like protein